MIRCPHRVNFRLTEPQFQRYAQMIGRIVGVKGWTDLCLMGLLELSKQIKGPWNRMLDVPTRGVDLQNLPVPVVCITSDGKAYSAAIDPAKLNHRVPKVPKKPAQPKKPAAKPKKRLDRRKGERLSS